MEISFSATILSCCNHIGITTFVDSVLNRVYGEETSFSPFILAEPDTDGDGMPDFWETANGLNPNDSLDASEDILDSDGLTNLEEYLRSLPDFRTQVPDELKE